MIHSEFRTSLEGDLGNSKVLCLIVDEFSKDLVLVKQKDSVCL